MHQFCPYGLTDFVKKHFKQKSLIILRSCNELLRRLSRAEDTVFCGRVFIFLFQSFPLGDKSAVNLRGEYHTENVTTFDDISKPATEEKQDMDVDAPDAKKDSEAEVEKLEPPAASREDSQESTQNDQRTPKVTISDGKGADQGIDLDELYPMFWGLQAYFSSPTKMFDPQHFATFKTGLESTLSTFQSVNTELETQSTGRVPEDRKSSKRKRVADEAEIASSFNPKYLTSRDLFDLEVCVPLGLSVPTNPVQVNDTAFRRHVLVQALILLDFMLSLTPKAKLRLSDMTNKSVLYGFVLSDEDVGSLASSTTGLT